MKSKRETQETPRSVVLKDKKAGKGWGKSTSSRSDHSLVGPSNFSSNHRVLRRNMGLCVHAEEKRSTKRHNGVFRKVTKGLETPMPVHNLFRGRIALMFEFEGRFLGGDR